MWIAVLISRTVQAVTFGAGAVPVLATPLPAEAMTQMPVVAASLLASIPISWPLEPFRL